MPLETKITEEEIRKMVETPIILIDRCKLPFEEMFAQKLYPAFSKEQLQERVKAIDAMCRNTVGIEIPDTQRMRDFAARSSAWHIGTIGDPPWSAHTNAVGMKHFGNAFRTYEQSSYQVKSSAIAPNSPYLKGKDYGRLVTGLKEATGGGKWLGNIILLHEVGHTLFPLYAKYKGDREISYRDEVLADGFAASAYLDLGGAWAHVEDFIATRRLNAFFDKIGSFGWSAAACEATLRRERIPSFEQAFTPVRTLQLRVMEELRDISRSDLDDAAYRKECQYNFEYVENGVSKRENVWNLYDFCFTGEFHQYPSSVLMAALDHVLEKSKKLSDGTRAEGEATLKAYERFCPEEAKKAFRPRGTTEVFKSLQKMM